MNSGIGLYTCDVMHRRHFPQTYRFDYKVFSLLLDVDSFQQTNTTKVLSFNRWNIFSVFTKDHGARDGTAWRPWIDALLDKNKLNKAKHSIKLLCFPRILGYAFNPLSLWYCYGEDNRIYAIVCEVRNTFGEHHHYVLHNNNQPYEAKVKAHKKKNFHVSPFINMNAEYQFTISDPNDSLDIVINEYQDNELMLTATQRGIKKQLDTPHLLGLFCFIPLMTFKIMWMIHWQALKIWIRGGKYHKKPNAPKEEFS